jgi:glycosyltransferase involved in cell wall biosynthesis
MRVTVTTEFRYLGTPDGAVWSPSSLAYSFWSRYLSVFDGVEVLARVKAVDAAPRDHVRCDGPGVGFRIVPYYQGPMQYLLKRSAIRAAIDAALKSRSAVILRLPSPIATTAARFLGSQGRGYGVEVVGDPYDVFAPGAIEHPLRIWFRWRLFVRQKHECAAATAAAYVTRAVLQHRYPPAPEAFTTHYSNVELGPDDFGPHSCRIPSGRRAVVLMVGSLEQMYKGADVLIRATALSVSRRCDFEIHIAGEGRCKTRLMAMANELRLSDRVHFLGHIASRQELRARLDQADLFVMPSRTEGLPRALIEAMARGLPCIGSNVGGITELLEAEDMVPPGDAPALASHIEMALSDEAWRLRASKLNRIRAEDFQDSCLRPRRESFYRAVRAMAEKTMAEK